MVNAFIMGSFVYHDYIWYPTQGKKVVNKWLQETEWGALFQQYAPRDRSRQNGRLTGSPSTPKSHLNGL